MTEQRAAYELTQARTTIREAEAANLNALARAYLDALSVERMRLYRGAWQGDAAARADLRSLCMALAALAANLPVEVVQ